MEEKRRDLDTTRVHCKRYTSGTTARDKTHELIDAASIKQEPDIKEEPQTGDLAEFSNSDHRGDGQSSVNLTQTGIDGNPTDLSIDDVKSEVKEEKKDSTPSGSNAKRSEEATNSLQDQSPERGCHGMHVPKQLSNQKNVSARNMNISTKSIQVKAPRLHHCDLCGYSTQYLWCLKRHLRTHTGEKPFPCDRCDKAFKSKRDLRNHMKVHAEEFQFHCAVCLMGFSQKNEKIEHQIHCKVIRYECHLCNKSFGLTKGNLIKHMLVHSGSTPFECKECSKQFTEKGNLKRHVKLHGGPRSFRCSICRERFAQQNEVTEHELKCNRRVYECYVCGKSIGLRKGDLAVHMRTHTGIKPFKCRQCLLKFTQNTNLTTHLQIHSRSLPWKCVICRQGFSMQTQCKLHQQNCHQRVYQCYVCDKFFGSRCTNLSGHMAKHSGRKQFRCGNRFALNTILIRHLNLIHDKKQ